MRWIQHKQMCGARQLLPSSWQCSHCSVPSEVLTSLPAAEPELRPSSVQTASTQWAAISAHWLTLCHLSVHSLKLFSDDRLWNLPILLPCSEHPCWSEMCKIYVGSLPSHGWHPSSWPNGVTAGWTAMMADWLLSGPLSSMSLSSGMWAALPGKTGWLFLEATSRFHSHIINTSHLILVGSEVTQIGFSTFH